MPRDRSIPDKGDPKLLSWNDIRGQERPRGILETALASGRVHHAYLFTGVAGVGKRLTALTFAAIVNCERRGEGEFVDACGECASCRKYDQLQHPDLMVVEPDGTRIKIAQIRAVQKAQTKQPYEARFRVVIVDDAHAMTDAAANALLKTLEEPSTRTRLVLITDQPHRLLDTIISRCQLLRFGALPIDDVVELLEQTLDPEEADEAGYDRETLRVAAGYGEGSVGRAKTILESGMLASRRDLIAKVTELDPAQPLAVLDLADEISSSKAELEGLLDVLKLFFRDVMIYGAGASADALVNQDLEASVAKMAQRLTGDDVLDLLDRIRQSQGMLAGNVNPQLVAEGLLDAFSHRTQSGRTTPGRTAPDRTQSTR